MQHSMPNTDRMRSWQQSQYSQSAGSCCSHRFRDMSANTERARALNLTIFSFLISDFLFDGECPLVPVSVFPATTPAPVPPDDLFAFTMFLWGGSGLFPRAVPRTGAARDVPIPDADERIGTTFLSFGEFSEEELRSAFGPLPSPAAGSFVGVDGERDAAVGDFAAVETGSGTFFLAIPGAIGDLTGAPAAGPFAARFMTPSHFAVRCGSKC
eukprot:1364853-Rhodomonas_salina.1